MKTTTDTTTNDLKKAAEAAVERYRQLAAQEQAVQSAMQRRDPNAARSEFEEVSIKVLNKKQQVDAIEARIASVTAACEASLALSAYEFEAGDDVAKAANLNRLLERMAEQGAEIARLRAALQAAEAHRLTIVSETQHAHLELAARRASEGLPTPIGLPLEDVSPSGIAHHISGWVSRETVARQQDLNRCREELARLVDFAESLEKAEKARAAERARRQDESRREFERRQAEQAAAVAEQQREKDRAAAAAARYAAVATSGKG